MKITFERSGGFMGMLVSTTINTDDLSESEALEFHTLLEQARFFELPEVLEGSPSGADQFNYVLGVEKEGFEPHVVQMTESSAPDELKTLLRKLTIMARGQQT